MFIFIMLIVYIILDIYVLGRMLYWLKQVMPLFKHKVIQAILVIVYALLASTIIFGAFLPRSSVQAFIKRMGNYWLGTFSYVLFFMIIADIVVLILKLIHRKKKINILSERKGYYIIGTLVIVFSLGFSTRGFIHAREIKTNTYDVTVDKENESMSSLRIALVADLHMGYSIGPDMIQKMTDKVNESDPDVVIFAGDIFNNDYDALQNPEKLEQILSSINSKMGVYAVYGNHDVTETLVGGFSVSSKDKAFRDKRMDEFLEKSNIKVLNDENVQIADGSINLIGRLDGIKAGDGTDNRKSLDELTENLDLSKLTIDIEHEPSKLKEVSEDGIDIMLSGHTHAGQYFPLTLAQPLVWENYCGMLKKNNMYSFVTSGVGTYGPYMRLGTDSEVMVINVKFNN